MHPIDQMQNPATEIEVRGHKIEIYELTMAGLPAFSRAVESFMEAFDEVADLPAARADEAMRRNTALFRLIGKHTEDMIAAAEVVTNANGDFYRKLKPDEFFQVASVIVERNATFFVQRLAPSLIKFAAEISLIGTMLSANLQPQDTSFLNS
ncbi:MAG: hypothetical protein VXW65_01265 [Pseudomonadota bacterium]|nr:hypothetical protein [Pseudomonadota bacterium]